MYSFCVAILGLGFVTYTSADVYCCCKSGGWKLVCALTNSSDVVNPEDYNCNHAVRRVELNLLEHTFVSTHEIPKTRITYLVVKGRRLKEVTDNAFIGLEKSLEYLHINIRSLRNVPVKAIQNLSELMFLDLSYNAIHSIDCTLQQHTSLKRLQLRVNQISSVYSCAFPKELSHLLLDMNRLESLNGSVKYHEHLKDLSIQFNAITSLDGELEGLNSLETLHATHNKIENISSSPVNLTNLRFLYLSRNNIADLGRSLEGFSNLDTLLLSHNKLWDLDEDLFFGMKNLKSLDLSYNFLYSFDAKKLFDCLLNLEKVWLEGNSPPIPVNSTNFVSSAISQQYTLSTEGNVTENILISANVSEEG